MTAVLQRRPLAIALTGLLACSFIAVPAQADPAQRLYHRTATYPVHQNAPAGEDPGTETVAEISSVSEDGRTLVYTDATAKRIGFLDITDPAAPQGLGTLSLADLGHADDQPTSVAVHGDYVLVVVDETGGDFTDPQGRVDVVRLSDRTPVASIDLQGQPDSIAISPDGAWAAIAIENQRDEEATPDGGEEGDLPQLPAGFVQTIELGGDPTDWSAVPVPLTADDGSALPELADLNTPTDPEPEYVTFNEDNQLAVTLQENNGVVVIDFPRREISSAFSAGTVSVDGIDTVNDGRIDQTGSITDVPREPDAIGWVGNDQLVTANEGDWLGGSRGWTVFGAGTGEVTWDAGNSFEQLAVRYGLHLEDRADKKGPEPEGLAITEIDGVPHALVASERSNFVAVYDLTDPASPQFRQLLFATNGPEGILPIPGRDLLAVSSEVDEADNAIRASVSLYELGEGPDSQPSIVSADDAQGSPIGWSALGALSADPGDPERLYAAADSALSPATVFGIDVTQNPAVIDSSLQVTEDGDSVDLDIEGLWARPEGGFWLADEGETGAENALIRTDAEGAILDRVGLPGEVADHLGSQGLEGVTGNVEDGHEVLYVAVQRPLVDDPGAEEPSLGEDGNHSRIGRYDVTTGQWSWLLYPLEETDTAGDWIGVSEITMIDDDTVAVIERDKLNGPQAKIKRIYAVEVPESAGEGTAVPVEKTLAHDVLPDLQATNGWVQEKLEGLTIGADGDVRVVTDNDATDGASGETVLLNLGSATEMFGSEPTPKPTTEPSPSEEPSPTGDPGPTREPSSPSLSGGSTSTAAPGGSLADTGAALGPVALIVAVVLTLAGGGVLLLRRRG
ncbi:esterase-like activity of phytase family protein [Naumannella halotolerans]|uniref:esterase-like activity of phytase family protein n=1 Tax=Naumannella halotolerans TaxID=993414 RepID=UPI00370D1FB6